MHMYTHTHSLKNFIFPDRGGSVGAHWDPTWSHSLGQQCGWHKAAQARVWWLGRPGATDVSGAALKTTRDLPCPGRHQLVLSAPARHGQVGTCRDLHSFAAGRTWMTQQLLEPFDEMTQHLSQGKQCTHADTQGSTHTNRRLATWSRLHTAAERVHRPPAHAAAAAADAALPVPGIWGTALGPHRTQQ